MEIIRINYTKDQVTKSIKTSEICFSCSACSKYCVITQFVKKYNLKDSFIVHLFTSGDPKTWSERAKDVWMCSVCEKCVTICPQDRDATVVFNNLKQQSYREGLAPDNIYGMIKLLIETGWAYPISSAINNKRTQLGLSQIGSHEKIVHDLALIAKKADLKKKGE